MNAMYKIVPNQCCRLDFSFHLITTYAIFLDSKMGANFIARLFFSYWLYERHHFWTHWQFSNRYRPCNESWKHDIDASLIFAKEPTAGQLLRTAERSQIHTDLFDKKRSIREQAEAPARTALSWALSGVNHTLSSHELEGVSYPRWRTSATKMTESQGRCAAVLNRPNLPPERLCVHGM